MQATPGSSNPPGGQAAPPWSPSLVLARVLGGGARLSIVVLIVGLVIALLAGQHGGSTLRADHIGQALRSQHGVGIIGIGLIVLICTPVCREAAALLLFARHRERPLAALAGVVLVLIGLSIVVGAH